jgi:hypothetical protein
MVTTEPGSNHGEAWQRRDQGRDALPSVGNLPTIDIVV